MSSHNFIKISLLTAYNAIHKFDVICSCETYLSSDIPLKDENLIKPGYKLIRVDHPRNIKHGGVYMN